MRYSVVFIFMLALFGCKPDPDQVDAGRVRLLVTVSHHNTPIPNAVVFRKNGTLEFPGQDTSLYEKRYVTDEQGKLILDDIGNGTKKILLYATGIDPLWDTTQQTPVWGYQYTTIETRIGESKDVVMVIPVSE
jgi:hypothetical protein